MPPYLDADAAGQTSVLPHRPIDPAPSDRAPTEPAPARTRTPAPGRGRSRRRRPIVDALAGVVVLVAFALAMTAVTGPRPGAAAVHAGPVSTDFLPIEMADAVPPAPRPGPAASTGSFSADCGRNEGGHRNSDNFITAPGRSNGAHHVHDYVGNTSTDGTSTDESLAAATTTCARGDKSVYFWPVLRDLRHAGRDAGRAGGGHDGNMGHILTPDAVALDYLGSPRGPVQPMPRFLRIVTGDAKAVTKGPGAARAHWTCSGTPALATATHYPLCPAGQFVQRVGEFPSCWNGVDLDSETHRSHVTFPDQATGACPAGTVAIPKLRITLSYRVPLGDAYAVDTFPDQQRKPITDHFDFENVMPERLMAEVTACLNTGRSC